ncbi:MAG: hypothetical protein ACRDWE_10680 [Acidimicrobiales bacterium]
MQESNDRGLADEVAQRARDAAYVAVGLGVLGIQKAQSKRRDLTDLATRAGRGDERLVQLRSGVAEGARHLAEWVDATAQVVSASFAPLEAQLPEPAREVAGRARAGLCAIGAQLRQVASPGD